MGWGGEGATGCSPGLCEGDVISSAGKGLSMCCMPSRGHAVRGRLELSPGICNNPFLQHCKVQLGTEDLPDGPQMFLLESKSAAFADAGVPHTRGEKGLVRNSVSREGQAGTARHTARGAVMKTAFLLRSPRTRLLIAGECGECQVGEFCRLI